MRCNELHDYEEDKSMGRYVLLANEDYNTSKNVEPILINSGYRLGA